TISDGVSEPYQSPYSQGPVTIVHNQPPSIGILQPNGLGDLADESFDIVWTDSDSDDDARIELYFAGNDSGPWTPIDISSHPDTNEDGISEDSEINTLTWNTAGLSTGNYWVRAVISDGFNLPVEDISDGPVAVNRRPQLTLLTPPPEGAVATDGYIIEWEDSDPDDNATISLFYSIDDDFDVNEDVVIVQDISEDDPENSYAWDLENVPSGRYWIFAVIGDPIWVPPIHVQSPGQLTVFSRVEYLDLTEEGQRIDPDNELPLAVIGINIADGADGMAQLTHVTLRIDDSGTRNISYGSDFETLMGGVLSANSGIALYTDYPSGENGVFDPLDEVVPVGDPIWETHTSDDYSYAYVTLQPSSGLGIPNNDDSYNEGPDFFICLLTSNYMDYLDDFSVSIEEDGVLLSVGLVPDEIGGHVITARVPTFLTDESYSDTLGYAFPDSGQFAKRAVLGIDVHD
ncbi:MAG: hypothetical protein GY869_01455, partial [Planctomycetes bacterium]|nr:hypothetical protein [Planctomycetota bacterium]